jgi:hypothetical protein
MTALDPDLHDILLLKLAEMLAGGEIDEGQYDAAVGRLAAQEELSLAGVEWLAEARQVGEVWQGDSGRWFTKNKDSRVVPAKAPGGQGAAPAAPKAAKPDAAKPAGGGKPAAAEAKATFFRGMKGKASADEVAGALAALSQKDLTDIKKLWGQKAGGSKAEQAKKLAEWALSQAPGGGKPASAAGAAAGVAPAKPATPAASPAKPEPAAPKSAVKFPTGDGLPERDLAAEKKMNAAFEAINATPAEKAALAGYSTEHGFRPDTFRPINNFLRGKMSREDLDRNAALAGMTPQQYHQKLSESIRTLDAVMARARLPEPVVVMRGISLGGAGGAADFMNNLKRAAATGQPIPMNGYQSTTTNSNVAGSFAGGGDNEIMFEISATRGAFLPSVSKYPHEAELLLPRNSQYRVVGFRDVNVKGRMTRVAQLEQIS